jgi:MFS family permease
MRQTLGQQETDDAASRDRARRLALAVCLAAGFTTLLDSSILNIAVPSLTRSLHASAEQVQWLLSSYSLTFGLALVPAGRAGDLRGRRALFLGGVGLFAAGSVISALSPAAGVVVFAQLLQGVGGGMISSQVLGTIQDMFDGPGRPKAMSAYGVASGLAGLTGPLLGALLVTFLAPGIGWRAVMAASTPLVAGTLIFGARYLPGTRPPRARAGPVAAPAFPNAAPPAAGRAARGYASTRSAWCCSRWRRSRWCCRSSSPASPTGNRPVWSRRQRRRWRPSPCGNG